MFNLRKISFAVALVAAPVFASAQDYRFEVSGAYSTTDIKNSSNIDLANVQGTFYWDQVNTAGHPLAEAAFLERQGGLTINYLNTSIGSFDNDTWSLAGDYYFDNGIYVAGRYSTPDEGEDTWGASLGYSPAAGLLFVVDADDNGDEWDYTGRVKYHTDLSGETSLGVDATVADKLYTLGGDYYFNRNFSVGAELAYDSDADYTGLAADVKYFFTPVFWVEGNVGTNVSGDADFTAWTVAAGFRF